MRRFEQAISKPRYHLMQFHRPAELKLKRWRQCNEKFVLCIFMDIYHPIPLFALWYGIFYCGNIKCNRNSEVRRMDAGSSTDIGPKGRSRKEDIRRQTASVLLTKKLNS